MASVANSQASEAARLRGNTLYKQGRFQEASLAFEEASKLAPNDPAPIANQSALLFEAGKYENAIHAITKALDLRPDAASKQKLYIRLLKCCIFAKSGRMFSVWRDLTKGETTSTEVQNQALLTRESVNVLDAWRADGPKSFRKLVMGRLPRYKPQLQHQPEYFPFGDDKIEFQLDKALLTSPSTRSGLSILLGGTGDGRHIFSHLLQFCSLDEEIKPVVMPNIHLTIVDLNASAIAKTLVLMDMMQGLAMKRRNGEGGQDTDDLPLLMAYVFSCAIIPPYIRDKMQGHLGMIIQMLDEGKQMFNGMFLPPLYRSQVIQCLANWCSELSDEFSPKKIRESIQAGLLNTRTQEETLLGPDKSPEMVVGEVTDTMERIQHDCLKGREMSDSGIDPSKFPRKYDRVHLSNTPDYVGGLIAPFLFGRPLLRDYTMANMRYNNLLNCERFPSKEHYQAQYMLMAGEHYVASHFALERTENRTMPPNGEPEAKDKPKNPAILEKLASQGVASATCVLGPLYFIWNVVPASRRDKPRKQLLCRTGFDHWAYSFFLKICFPHPSPKTAEILRYNELNNFYRSRFVTTPVYSPLNLTVFMRLLSHMAATGYPGHWISSMLTAIMSGEIKTTARVPQQLIADREGVETRHPEEKMCVAPFMVEMSTLCSIWSPLLPFGILAAPGTLVYPKQVVECAIAFPEFTTDAPRAPHFILVFGNKDCEESMAQLKNRCFKGTLGGETQLHVFTTFKYESHTRTATFWCRNDVVEDMKEHDWKVHIHRTDAWEQVTDWVDVKSNDFKVIRTW